MATDTVRDRILAAALAEFAAHGFERATIVAIRRRAQVSNGSFFHVFADKEELAEALYLAILDAYHADLVSAFDAHHDDPAGGIAGIIRVHLGWVADHPDEARFLLARGTPDWTAARAATIARINQRLIDRFADWASAHIAAGRLVDLPPALMLAIVIGPAQIVARAAVAGTGHIDLTAALVPLIRAAQAALLTGRHTKTDA